MDPDSIENGGQPAFRRPFSRERRRELGEGTFVAFKKGTPIPLGIKEAMIIDETGLPPQVLDEMPDSLVHKLLIYRQIKNVAINGGDWKP